ncbi:MAG: molecular chaperone Hsp33, partial [Spirochaetes bacterium]
HASRALNSMRANHGLGAVESAVLGKGLLAAALMAALLKDPGSILLRIDGSGPAEGLSAEAARLPSGSIRLRGRLFVSPFPPQALGAESAEAMFGSGALTVTRMEGQGIPFVGSVPLRSGNLNKDLPYYFLESEQTRTAVDTGIYFIDDGRLYGAGALLLQALPGAEDSFVSAVEAALSALPPLGLWFSQGGTRENLIKQVFGRFGARRTGEGGIDFDCPCSSQRFLDHIAALDRATVSDILANGPWPLETTCHYCASTYRFDKETLEKRLGVASKG